MDEFNTFIADINSALKPKRISVKCTEYPTIITVVMVDTYSNRRMVIIPVKELSKEGAIDGYMRDIAMIASEMVAL